MLMFRGSGCFKNCCVQAILLFVLFQKETDLLIADLFGIRKQIFSGIGTIGSVKLESEDFE